MYRLFLRNNALTGSIPKEIGMLKKLFVCWFYSNKLSGPIPPELGNCKRLAYLDLKENELSGEIPSELGSCVKLQDFSLQGNTLSGVIPRALGSLKCLTILDLQKNELSGKIPPELGDCTALSHIYLQDNPGLGGEIPDSVNKLPNLNRIHVNSGLQIKGKLGKDAEAVQKCWEAMGGDKKEIERGDIYNWRGVKINSERVTEIGE